ncbi:MAG: 16S rRNA (cytidine(1402)-2'-O)-methyltransferase [Gemmatimonadota bacterium]
MATLYLVSTPIGNLEDLTRRAERVLASCDRILAEDTRRTGTLLRHLGIEKPLVSLHAHNEAERSGRVRAWLGAGETLCLVSDAGTPVVSDPGRRVVEAVLEGGHEVVPVPGPSAVLAALAASGLSGDRFVFLGFVPRKGGERKEVLERIVHARETVVCFESPERLVRLLEELEERLGEAATGRRVAVGRELTKLHEEVFRGTLSEAARYYGETGVRGEVTLVVEAAPVEPAADAVDEAAARALARVLLDEGRSPSRTAREVARRMGVPRNAAYRLVQDEREGA